jgi:hypothetical protein
MVIALAAAGAGCASRRIAIKYFHNNVQLLSSSMNSNVLLLPLERLGLVVSWHSSYDKNGALGSLITWGPKTSTVYSVIIVNKFHFLSIFLAQS